MTMRKTPYQRIRYPWASDTVSAADVQAMASDVDRALVQTANMASNFSRMASVVVQRTTTQSLTKGTLTAITFDTPAKLDNGTNSPQANGAWFSSATPTRLTAPTACVVLASAMGGVNFTSSGGTSTCVQVTVAINGGTAAPNVQGSKWWPLSTQSGNQYGAVLSMWKMNAGDYLELKMYWTGSQTGPFNTDTTFPPTLALMMVALPAVP